MEKIKTILCYNVLSFLPSESFAQKLQLVKATKPHLDKVFESFPHRYLTSVRAIPYAVC